MADGLVETSANLMTAAGAFAFVSSLLGYYCVFHGLCQDAVPFSIPMGDTSRVWKRWCNKTTSQNSKSEKDMA
jgi:L-lactate utilization protein LutB